MHTLDYVVCLFAFSSLLQFIRQKKLVHFYKKKYDSRWRKVAVTKLCTMRMQ